jgi:kynurenine 3-monooxygenase
MPSLPSHITLIGAGLCGSLMAILLARRGMHVTVFERRSDLRQHNLDAGRSINLALADRGLHALRVAGLAKEVTPLLMEMPGRMVHDLSGATTFLKYGQAAHETNYSISRAGLNRLLLEHAERTGRIEFRFEHSCVAADFAQSKLNMRDEQTRTLYTLPLEHVVATDGSSSAVRHSLVEAFDSTCVEDVLPHGYKELTLAAASGKHRLDPKALHIWPRGAFMMIGLPNVDGTFTLTLFLPFEGAHSFAELTEQAAVQHFFNTHFSDLMALAPELGDEFFAHPTGRMSTVRCERWTDDHRCVLMGDAAHAIVPFHGQGMNCAFEDCIEFDALLDRYDWASACTEFTRRRKPNTDAIAEMAIENYVEMRDTVRDPRFQLHKEISFELERRFPKRFIPRYSMVMFHHEIPYAVAYERGAVQAAILQELTHDTQSTRDVSFVHARELIEAQLPEIG